MIVVFKQFAPHIQTPRYKTATDAEAEAAAQLESIIGGKM